MPASALVDALPRPDAGSADAATVATVRDILAQVREGGDDAVRALTARFDRVQLDELAVPPTEWKRALDAIPADVRAALEFAAANVRAFQQAEAAPPVRWDHAGIVVRTV